MNGANALRPWRVAPRADEAWPRLVVERLLAGDCYAKRRVAGDVRAAGHRQVAANLGISAPWLRALLREPAPTSRPVPSKRDFVWVSTPGPINNWSVSRTVRSPMWIPLDIDVRRV